MSLWDRLLRRRSGMARLTLEELRVEEKRLEIRENQALAKLEKIDREREDIFHQGAKTHSPARRRIYARRFSALSQRATMIEREALRLGKELITVGRLRSILERSRGGGNLLERLKEGDLMKVAMLLEDDRISEEVYLEKIDSVLGIVSDPAYESAEIGQEGLEVLKTWEQMDEGGLEADEALRETIGRGTKERPEKEPHEGESQEEPA